MLKVGAGYNPCFIALSDANRLVLPPYASLIELGLAELKTAQSIPALSSLDFSLHIARCPITEEKSIQKSYLQELHEKTKESNFKSIGFHVTGPRNTGIGRFGFSSHYTAENAAEDRAVHFVRLAQEIFQLPIWLENANFYSGTREEVLENWKSFDRIVQKSGAKSIIDVSHLIIDSTNVGLPPEALLGLISWENVAEFHLSGINESQDGALHDGHNRTVHNKVWDLLNHILPFLGGRKDTVFLTVEHTDPQIRLVPEEFRKDYDKANELTYEGMGDSHARNNQAEHYAQSYLSRLIKRRFPNLEKAIENSSHTVSSLILEWVKETSFEGGRVLLSEAERFQCESDKNRSVDKDFIPFVKRKLAG